MIGLHTIHTLGAWAYWQQTVLRTIGVILAVLLPAGGYVQVFLFKMMSHMQSRLGPMEAGPHGSLQLVAEVGKFLQKEDVAPVRADKALFKLPPYIVVAAVVLVYVAVPFGPHAIFADLDIGIFFALGISSISVLGILVAGWASANKYSLTGGLRAAGQLIAYEIPLVLAVVGVVVQAGTLNLQKIVQAQAEGNIFGFGRLGLPFILTQFVGFLIFITAMQAELTQTPFDMPIAESEIIAGYMTEYTGMRFLLFFIAEFAAAGAFAALASTLFLGGWYLPGLSLHATYMNFIGPAILFAKMMLVGFLVFWVRFSFPRLREDQLQSFAWKFLIPLSLVNLMATAVLKVVF